MSKKLFSVILMVVMVFSSFVCTIAAEETNENSILTFNCSDGTNNYTDLAYNYTRYRHNSTAPNYFRKTISVSESANYTFFLNAGLAKDITAYVYIARVQGGECKLISTDAIENIKKHQLFENVPLEAGVSYAVTIFNDTSSSTIRLQDIVLEKNGGYKADVDTFTILAYDSVKTTNVQKIHRSGVRYTSSGAVQDVSYKLKPGAGNYKVSMLANDYNGRVEDFDMKVDGVRISRFDDFPSDFSNKAVKVEIGTISVTDDEFTLNITLKSGTTQVSKGIYIYDITLERIDEPIVTVHSSDVPTYSNVVSKLQEGTLTAKAYLPENLKDKSVAMLFAVYDGEGLYKVEKTVVEVAAKNQTVNVTINDIAFEEGKTYTSKVFFLNDMDNIQAYYKNPAGGSLTGTVEVETVE